MSDQAVRDLIVDTCLTDANTPVGPMVISRTGKVRVTGELFGTDGASGACESGRRLCAKSRRRRGLLTDGLVSIEQTA